MRLKSRGIDEYTLAAYLSGRLTPDRRREVANYLSRNHDARDLLLAAGQLMESEGDGYARGTPALRSVGGHARRLSLLGHPNRLSILFWSVVILVSLTAFATTTFIAVRVGMEMGKATPVTAEDWPLLVSGPVRGFSWAGREGDAVYRVTVWNEATGEVVSQIESEVPFLSREGVLDDLPTSTPVRVWVDAFDSGGRLLRRSRALTLVPPAG